MASRNMYLLLVLFFFELFHAYVACFDEKSKTGPIDVTCFHSLDDIYEYMNYLSVKDPDFVTVESISIAAEKREIKYIRMLSEKPSLFDLVISGGIQGDDCISVSSVTYIMKELVENRKEIPKELLKINFYIFPVLNPSGYKYTRPIRKCTKNRSNGNKSCFGVNLNKNFVSFPENTSNDPCSGDYSDSGRNSELETKEFSEFLKEMYEKGTLKAHITFHSNGQSKYISYPFHDKLNIHNGELYDFVISQMEEPYQIFRNRAREISKVKFQYTYEHKVKDEKLQPGSESDYSGSSGSWIEMNLLLNHVSNIELGDINTNGVLTASEIIKSTGAKALEAVKTVGAAVYTEYSSFSGI